jgi:hypothetical protein
MAKPVTEIHIAFPVSVSNAPAESGGPSRPSAPVVNDLDSQVSTAAKAFALLPCDREKKGRVPIRRTRHPLWPESETHRFI